MSERIPQSVSKLVVFRAFLASDHVTPATGKTIAITISKNGGAFGNPNAGATNATEISSGFYKFTLDTTDTGTGGPLAWRGAVATIDDAADVYFVADAHNAGFDGVPSATAGGAGGLPVIGTGANNFKSDSSANVTFANTSIATVTTLTNAPSDSSGVTTLLTRIGGTITISGGLVSADTKKINAATVQGDGTSGNLWRG